MACRDIILTPCCPHIQSPFFFYCVYSKYLHIVGLKHIEYVTQLNRGADLPLSFPVQAPRFLLLPSPVWNDAVWPDPWAAGRPQAFLLTDWLRLPHRCSRGGLCPDSHIVRMGGNRWREGRLNGDDGRQWWETFPLFWTEAVSRGTTLSGGRRQRL